MTAIILGWNPGRWNRWAYDAVIEQIAETGQVLDRCSVGRRRKITPGTEAWLLLQGQNQHGRGLIGHGIVTSESYEAPHYSDPSATLRYVSVTFDALLPLGSQIPLEVLAETVSGVRWSSLRESGRSIPPGAEVEIRRLWQDLGPGPGTDPTTLTPGTYPQGSVARVEVNRYERSPEAKRLCLAFHGTSCAACGFSFEAGYGEVARDFVQVHHIVPASQLGPGYQLDPIADLVPLCANCHNVAHLRVSTPRSVPELRALITSAGHMSGQVLDQETLEAQAGARRILEQQ
ncbi:HNH endonuclease [Arthrobacter sp. ISL-48]|uniref:HNH endonuclease n=1 Tax=Arthrobacter sp. ISL-48 TaxID=2819110 RepID=UPI001BE6F307|nr:HNH endonuclease [Arthrobacter sp. ISL-48]MBT2533352.1 HNH endonuclease [Arthrobacter sp. ISL-48]